MSKLKYNIDYLKTLARHKQGLCLSIKYINTKTKYLWQCKNLHIWLAPLDRILNNHWCLKCSGSQKKDIDFLHKIASNRQGKCLSCVYINIHSKYDWECKLGHRWRASANDVQRGNWCKLCSGLNIKDLQWCQDMASKRRGKCLSSEYINSKTKMRWECHEGHQWEAKANSIKNGNWCLKCSGKYIKNIDFCIKLAISKKGKCLSTKYINMLTKMRWECHEGHQWEATANDISNNCTWCPECSHIGVSKAELEIYKTIKDRYPEAIGNKTVFKTEPRLRPDIYIPSLKLILEIDGSYWHSNEYAKNRDFRKERACRNEGIDLIRIPWEYYNDNPRKTLEEILSIV